MGKENMQSKIARNRSSHYLFVLLLGVALVSLVVLYRSRGDSAATRAGTPVEAARAFSGGKFEASGVTHVPGTDAVLFVDDGKAGEVQWMRVDREGNQSGPVKAVRVGVNIEDLEGITTDGSYFYMVSSQSRSKGEGSGLARFKLDPGNQNVMAVETIDDLKRLLVENVAELRDSEAKKAKDDGINIEGLAWDPAGGRLLLGLRSPVIDGHAIVVPLKLRDPRGPFSIENLEAKEMAAIRLSLGGQGVRSIEYDEQSKQFYIISGATETQEKTDFKLWEWGGPAGQSALREVATFDRKLKPEGVTRASVGESNFVFVVFDSSKYMRLK
jgi:hypothetical protein